MTVEYVELHSKSFYSFGQGASHLHELLTLAGEHGYPALALADTNLYGSLEFARLANSLGIRPITGGGFTLTDGSCLPSSTRHWRATPTSPVSFYHDEWVSPKKGWTPRSWSL